jgi:hypothetical protein
MHRVSYLEFIYIKIGKEKEEEQRKQTGKTRKRRGNPVKEM